MRKYKKFSIVLEIFQYKWTYNKKVDCTGNYSQYMNENIINFISIWKNKD